MGALIVCHASRPLLLLRKCRSSERRATSQRVSFFMSDGNDAQAERELSEISGALDVLFTLREEFAQWVEEAQDETRKEELDNVYQHVAAMEAEYRRRRDEAQKRVRPS